MLREWSRTSNAGAHVGMTHRLTHNAQEALVSVTQKRVTIYSKACMNVRRQKGYTLIELLLYVTIVSSLLLAVTTFFGMSVEGRVKNQTVSEIDQQGTFALNYIAQTIRNATAITSPAIGASADQLTVTVPNASLSPTVFSLAGSVLQVKEGSGAAIPLTSNVIQVSNLTFKNLSRSSANEIVQISFTLSRVNPSGRNEFSYQKTFTTSAVLR